MNETEERLRRVFEQHAAEAPAITHIETAQRSKKPVRWEIFGPVVAVVATVLIVGAVISLTPSNPSVSPARPSELSTTQSIPLPRSDWQPGDASDMALLEGRLIERNGCLSVGGELVIWPRGFTAARTADGDVVVFDSEGLLRVTTGESLHAGGGFGPVSPDWLPAGSDCAKAYPNAFVIQDEQITQPGQTNYPINASGQTYGNLPTGGEGMSTEDIPDLIGVKGNTGKYGYITKHDFLGGPPPANPSQALEVQATAKPVTVPVYASDGVTIIDSFTIG